MNKCIASSLKDIQKRLKREASNWEKILKIHKTDKGLISRIYNKLQIYKTMAETQ